MACLLVIQVDGPVLSRKFTMILLIDKAAQLKYKKDVIYVELGRNNLLFQTGLKRWMDPKNVFVCDNAIFVDNPLNKPWI